MKWSFSLLTLFISYAACVNRTLTNGWGSTPAQRHYISASQAQTVIKAAIAHSSVPNNIAVLDPSSQLVAFLRMDNAYLGSVDISIKKAKTVTSFNGQFPSYGLLNSSQPGGDLYGIEETNGGLVVFGVSSAAQTQALDGGDDCIVRSVLTCNFRWAGWAADY